MAGARVDSGGAESAGAEGVAMSPLEGWWPGTELAGCAAAGWLTRYGVMLDCLSR